MGIRRRSDRRIMKGGTRVAEDLQRTHVRAQARGERPVVWCDPNLVKGFVPTELWKYVSRMTSPTLYLIGGNSKIVPPEAQQRLKQTLPRVEIIVMPGLGHYPHLEAPADFLAATKTFLSRTAGTARE